MSSKTNFCQNFVCFECKKAYRRNTFISGKPVICAVCRRECIRIGYVWRVPSKEDRTGWDQMRERFKHMIPKNTTEHF